MTMIRCVFLFISLDQYDADISAKEADIAELELQEQEQLEEFYRQVRWMEETGSVSYLSILFTR